MNLSIFFIKHYSILALSLFSCYLWGGGVAEKMLPGQRNDKIFLNTATGLGILVVYLFLASLCSLLNVAVVVTFLCLAPIYQLYHKLSIIPPLAFSKQSRNVLLVCAASLVIVFPILFLPLYPPTRWDEISYHLPYAKLYADVHKLAINPFLRYPLYAHNIDLLYTFCLLISDDILAHVLHAACAFLTAIGIYQLGKDTHSKSAGLIAAGGFLGSWAVLLLIGTAYIDLGLTLFVFLAFFCLSKWTSSRDDSWLYLAGGAVGIALGAKYSGFLYLGLFAVWVIFDSRKAISLAKFLLPALLLGTPWYIRNFLISGDPLFPFGGKIFGYWLWNESDLVEQGKDLLVQYGTPRTLKSFLELPWNLVFHRELFMDEGFSPAVLALFPGFLMARWLPPFYQRVAVYILFNLVLWFMSTQIVRYLLPTLPMMMLFSAVAMSQIFSFITKGFRAEGMIKWRVVGRGGAIVVAILPLLYAEVEVIAMVRNEPIPITQEMRDRYLGKTHLAYSLLQVANQHPELSIYQLGFENSFYFSKGTMMGDWFGPARYSTVSEHLGNSAKLRDTLKSLKADFFLFNKNRGFKIDFDYSHSPDMKVVAETPDAVLLMLR